MADDETQEMFREIIRVHTQVRKCFESDKPEASSVGEVVRPLLDLVRKGDCMLHIPSVMVSGHNWQVCYSYMEEGGYTRVSDSILHLELMLKC